VGSGVGEGTCVDEYRSPCGRACVRGEEEPDPCNAVIPWRFHSLEKMDGWQDNSVSVRVWGCLGAYTGKELESPPPNSMSLYPITSNQTNQKANTRGAASKTGENGFWGKRHGGDVVKPRGFRAHIYLVFSAQTETLCTLPGILCAFSTQKNTHTKSAVLCLKF